MKKQSSIVDMTPVRKEVLSPQEFLRVAKERTPLIARSRFVPPALGRADFGRVEVEYTVPLLKRAPV